MEYQVHKTAPKNTVKNTKHLKIQHLSNNPKKYNSCEQYPRNTDFRNLKPKKYSAHPCL